MSRQNGEVLIHGVPAAQIKEEERRKLFGYVEQTFHMVPGTVREEITLFDPAITEEQVHAAAELTGLKEAIETWKTVTIRYVRRNCFHRDSGSCFPSRGRQRQIPLFYCSTKSRQTSMQRRKKQSCRL